ncbi:MAG: hypothetical protein AB1757_29465 [Acidobacteriota bacterium]
MSEQLTRADFNVCLNTTFNVQAQETIFPLELLECNDLGTTDKQEQFSLIFRGPINWILQQMIYPVSHERLGDLELFLVPIKKDNQGVYYEAIFNYFRE